MRPRLRILHTESSHGWGGQEVRILTEARGMQDRGHEVLIVTTDNAELLPVAARMGLETAVLPMRRKGVRELLAMRAWLARNHRRFDVINTHSSTDSWLVALARRTIPGCPPMVRTRHVSTAVNNSVATRWLYLRATSHIVVTGEALRQQLHEKNGFPMERMTSIRTGIDLERFRPLDKAAMRRRLGVPDRTILGIVATLRDWKGHDHLLEAMQALKPRFPDLMLIVVGDGPRRAHLERRTDELALRDVVRFVGNQDNVEEWLATFDLFALPSYGEEGVPQAIMQAMACGIPVVSTPIGAIPEAVKANETGLLVPPRDPSALSGAISALIGDSGLRQRLAQASTRFAQANFALAVMVEQMESVFRMVGGI